MIIMMNVFCMEKRAGKRSSKRYHQWNDKESSSMVGGFPGRVRLQVKLYGNSVMELTASTRRITCVPVAANCVSHVVSLTYRRGGPWRSLCLRPLGHGTPLNDKCRRTCRKVGGALGSSGQTFGLPEGRDGGSEQSRAASESGQVFE